MLLKTGSALGKIRVYEVLDDGISLVFKGGKRLVVPFSEVQSLCFVPMERGRRGFWKRMGEDISRGAAALGLSHQSVIGPYRSIKTAPMFAAPAKEGFVFLRRKKGISSIRAQAKIGTDRMKILQEARNLGLTPAHTVQFYEQLNAAFMKWQSKHCVHCASPVQTSGACISCSYTRVLDTPSADSTQKGTNTIRPVRNRIVEVLEFIFNPNSLGGIVIFLSVLLGGATWKMVSLLLAIFLLLCIVQFAFPAAIWYFKRKAEKGYVVEVTSRSLAYVGDLPYLRGLTIPFQDILSVRRYSNPWQRLFGLGNIEIETRNSVPMAVRMALFSFLIPSIRNGKELEELLRQRCNFLKK
jgi:hypothetical protein